MSRLAALFLLLGVILLPLRAVAATIPVLTAYDVAVRSTATTLGKHDAVRPETERARTACDDATFAYDDSSNWPTAAGLRGVLAYDGAVELTERRELTEGAIYDATAPTGSRRGRSEGKFGYLFGEASGNAHNVERARSSHAPTRAAMEIGLQRILRRTARHDIVAMQRLHDTLNERWNEIVALAEHRPQVGRLEALNNNWETLVRRARGYRNYDYLLRKLRFMTGNPIRNDNGVRRFLALGITPPMPRRKAA